LIASRGAAMSTDDSFWLIPFNPNQNPDYTPVLGQIYVGLLSIVTDTGIVNWVNVYTTTFTPSPVDG